MGLLRGILGSYKLRQEAILFLTSKEVDQQGMWLQPDDISNPPQTRQSCTLPSSEVLTIIWILM